MQVFIIIFSLAEISGLMSIEIADYEIHHHPLSGVSFQNNPKNHPV